MSPKIWILHKINKKGYFKQKCQASEKYVHFYALNTWLGFLLHELLHQCGVAWRQSACGSLCGGCQWSSSGPLLSQECSSLLWFQRTRDTQNLYCMDSRGVTRHETEFTRTRRDFFLLFFKSSKMKYIGKNSILFNWKIQKYFEINLYFMKLNLFFN